MLTTQELKSMNLKELVAELAKARQEAQKIRIHVKTKHEKNTSKVNKIKKYIARIETFKKEVEKSEAKPAKNTEAENKVTKK